MKSLHLFFVVSVLMGWSCGGQAERSTPSIAAARSGFVAVGERTFAVSDADGRSWRRGALPIDAHKVAFIHGRVFALGEVDKSKAALAVTDDLTTWRTIDLPRVEDCSLNDIAFFDQPRRLMIVGGSWTVGACVFTSLDNGSSWTREEGQPEGNLFYSFVRGSDRPIVSAVLASDQSVPSVHVWNENRFDKLPQPNKEQRNFREAIDIGAAGVLVVGCGGSVCRWTDASSYAPIPDGPEIEGAWTRIARGDGRLVIAGELFEKDGIAYGVGVRNEATGTRIDVVLRSKVFLTDVAYDGGRFAVTSSDGTVYVSPTKDGLTFNEALGAGKALKSIAPLR